MGFWSLLRHKSPVPPSRSEERVLVYARIHEKIQPLERGDRYETPLGNVLKDRGFGEVVGAGTMVSDNGDIEYVGIDLELSDLDQSLPFVVDFLTRAGAPKGSALEIWDGNFKRTIPFGL